MLSKTEKQGLVGGHIPILKSCRFISEYHLCQTMLDHHQAAPVMLIPMQ